MCVALSANRYYRGLRLTGFGYSEGDGPDELKKG